MAESNLSDDATALIEVTGHFEITGRGILVTGHPRGGNFRERMLVRTGHDPAVLIVSGLEIGHNRVEVNLVRTSHAVVFRDAPSLEFVKNVFPVGSVLRGEEAPPADR